MGISDAIFIVNLTMLSIRQVVFCNDLKITFFSICAYSGCQ